MNPLTNVKNIQKLNERMLDMGVADETSWHKQYKDSAYVFIGGLPYDLSEGDILCVFSQYGEIVNVNLVRDKATGKQKGFCFLCYEDQRSTILAVDNFNGTKLGGRTIRVDHCANYRRPKGDEKDDDGNRKDIMEEGCAPQIPSPSPSEDELSEPVKKKTKKVKKHKKHKERKSRSRNDDSSDSESENEDKKTKRHYTDEQRKTQTYHNRDSSDNKRHASREHNHHQFDKDNHTKTTSTREWDNGKQPDERKQSFDIKKEVTDNGEYSSREKHFRNNRRENEGSSYGGIQKGNTDHSRDKDYHNKDSSYDSQRGNTDHSRNSTSYGGTQRGNTDHSRNSTSYGGTQRGNTDHSKDSSYGSQRGNTDHNRNSTSYGGTQRGNTDHSKDSSYGSQRGNTDHSRNRDYHNYERETSRKYHERDFNEKRGYKK